MEYKIALDSDHQTAIQESLKNCVGQNSDYVALPFYNCPSSGDTKILLEQGRIIVWAGKVSELLKQH